MIKVISTATGKANFGKTGKIIFLIICVLFIIGGSFGLYISFNNVTKAIQSLNWDTTKGEIITSEIKIERNYDSDSVNKYMYSAYIEYNYTVNLKTYISNRIAFGSEGVSSSIKSFSQDVVNKYPVGKIVTVYYDSENPSESVLEPGFNINQLILFLLSILFVLIGILLPIILFRSKKFNSFIRRGDIKINTDKKSFKPGERIRGNLILNIKKPVIAESLKIFFGAEKLITRGNPYRRSMNTTTTKYNIFKDEKSLGFKREYFNNENLNFEISIPENIFNKIKAWEENGGSVYGLNQNNSSEKARAMQRGAKEFLGKFEEMSRIKEEVLYFIEAQLCISKRLDIKGKIYIELMPVDS